MMKTKTTSGVASSNDNPETRYVLFVPAHKGYLTGWCSNGWTYELSPKIGDALHFKAMTQALLVGFCLGFGSSMETQLVQGQAELWNV